MFPPDTRILLVDDMAAIRELVRNHLKSIGFVNFYHADNGEDAFRVLETQYAKKEPVQLVISDWNMPVMSGFDLLRKIRNSDQFKDLAFVMLTAESEKHQVLDAIEAGASQYVLKPFTGKTIEDKLKMVWKKISG